MRLILYRSGNEMTLWCPMPQKVALWASIMTSMMCFWLKDLATDDGNWVNSAMKALNLSKISLFVSLMIWVRLFLMKF